MDTIEHIIYRSDVFLDQETPKGEACSPVNVEMINRGAEKNIFVLKYMILIYSY